MSQSFAQYFQNAYFDSGKIGYIRAHYDITSVCSGRIDASGRNIISRLRNHLVHLMNEQVVPPKAIIIILDDEMLKELNHFKPGISEALGRLFEWLLNQFHRLMTAHKEKLPTKSRKFKFPTFIWFNLPTHNGFKYDEYRIKYNAALEKAVILFQEMKLLKFLNWDAEDNDLISDSKFTSFGLTKYWMSVNDAFEIWDRDQMQIQRKNQLGCEPSTTQKKYKW